MVLGDIKEVILRTLGKRDLEPVLLEYILESGRRAIEKENNWYYMKKTLSFTLTIDQQEYSVASGGDVNEANFKQSRMLMQRDPSETRFYEVVAGDRSQLDLEYSTGDSWAPEAFVIDENNGTTKLFLYPPKPDKAYVMRWLVYTWTSNPSSDTGTDELVSRWPELLTYSSLAQGFRIVTKDEQLAGVWDQKMALEMQNLKRYDWYRTNSERQMIVPRRGPYRSSNEISSSGRKIFY